MITTRLLHLKATISEEMQHSDSNNTEKSDEKRSSLFTVQDVEAAIIYFTYMTGLYPVAVIAHEL